MMRPPTKRWTHSSLRETAVDENFLGLRDLHDMAVLCNLDPSYLCRLFQRFADTTPYKYLLGLKMRSCGPRS